MSASTATRALDNGASLGIETGLLDVKSRPASSRPGLVPRTRLVRRLLDAPHVPVALLVAPAGYGKTTLLSEWAAHDERPFAWVSLDDGDNDPGRLLAAIAYALDAIEPIGRDVFDALSAPQPDVATVVLPRLARSLIGRKRSFVLALDDVHVLHAREVLLALAAIGQVLHPGSQLVLASRSLSALPVGRLRAHGSIVELGYRDLTMTPLETAALLSRARIEVGSEDILSLARRTEGWPAGLSLAALSLQDQHELQDQHDVHAAVARFSGDDRFVAEYVREEFLSQLPRDRIRFLTRTSVLDQLSGPVCDATLGREGSARMLADLAGSNLLLVPLDRSGGWYRYHTLFAEALRGELRRLEPELEGELHRRASTWFAKHDDVGRAIQHAIDAHDVERAGDLLWRNVLPYTGRGRRAMVQRWLGRFTEEEIAACPPLALVAANSHFAAGNLNEVEHWTSVAASGLDQSPPRSRMDSLEAGLATMRAGIARQGIVRMGEDAARAHGLQPEDSPWRSICHLLQGAAAHLAGDCDRAETHLQEGAHRAAIPAPSIQALCLAQLALLSLDRDDWENGAVLASRARAQVERFGLTDYPTLALVFAVSAAIGAHRGQPVAASSDLRRGQQLLAMLVDFSPWYEVEVRIVLARAALRLGDWVAARPLLAEASRILRQTPDAVVLGEWLAQARAEADAASGSTVGAGWSLTTAELRVLQFLPSHLSFREIAKHLYVSPNTVKTHARAVYRKLDASSRGEAVDHARDAGLL